MREVSKSENISVDTLRQVTRAENVDADTKRKVTADEIISADSLRRVVQVDSVTADTYREVKKTDSVVGDVRRQVTVSENISADTYLKIVRDEIVPADIFREVKKTEKIIADTSRKNGLTSISGDTDRTVKRYTDITADTWRKIAGEENISGNTSRRVVQSAEIQADISRRIQRTENCIADTKRAVTVADKFFADAYRQTVRTDIAKADTFRKVTTSISNSVDTVRKVGVLETISADTKRTFANKEQAVADTLLQTAATEEVTADLLRGIREVVEADTFRQVVRKEKTIASTVIRVPHVLNYILENKFQMLNKPRLRNASAVSLINTFKEYGVTAVDITLSEKTLSDNFSFSTSRPLEIEDTVQGWLLDYPFHFIVEETDQTDLIQDVKGRYSKDKQLYSQFFISCVTIMNTEKTIEVVGGRFEKYDDGTVTVLYPRATEIMRNIATALGVAADVRIDDFTPYNLSGDQKITYVDLLNTLFSWTSRLPQRQINVFIRDDVLHVIQRGKEDSVFDISDLPHSRPNINKKLIRSLWSSPKGEDGESSKSGYFENDPTIEYLYDEVQEPFSGTISFYDVDETDSTGCSTTLVFSEGLLIRESNRTFSPKRSTSNYVTYDYVEIFPAGTTDANIIMRRYNGLKGDWYLKYKETSAYAEIEETDPDTGEKEIKKTSQSGSTKYFYTRTDGGDLYLQLERESTTTTTTTITISQDGTSTVEDPEIKSDTRETYHVPLGNGWYGQSVFQNGIAQGSSISQGTPGNKVTQYMVNEVQKTFSGWKIIYKNPDADDDDDDDDDTPKEEIYEDTSKEETYEDWRRRLAPIADISFPVREFNLLKTLTAALLWLNRKIQKTVTLDLIANIVDGVPEINHIVDFTERVKLDGEEYFLVSNKIAFTPFKLIQKLQLIRWD